MLRLLSVCGAGAVVSAALGSSVVFAQVVISSDGLTVNGVDLSPYGGAASITVESYSTTPGFAAGVIAPYPLGWGGLPFSSPFGGYGGYYGGWYGGYGYAGPWGGFYPPVVLPAETMYGPGAVRRMMGVDPPLGTPIIQQTTIVASSPKPVLPGNNNGFGANAPANPNRVPPPPMNLAATNPATQQRARKIVDTGDAAFQQQRFGDALSNYKDATRAAPDLAETYFRQAAAAVALGRYDDAVAAIKLGLRLQPSWVDSQFRFAALYGGAELARRQHLDALQQVVNDRPSSDLLFLFGVLLYFDEAPQRAGPLFTRAGALAVGETWHIGLFQEAVKRLPPDAAAPPIDPAKPVVPAADGARDI